MVTQEEEALREMLLETASVLEFHNLVEFLPLNVLAWYDQQKLNQEREDKEERTPAMDFIETYVKKEQ